jgi:hypothetical protein
MTAPTETSVVAPTAKDGMAKILFDIDEASLKLFMIGMIQD